MYNVKNAAFLVDCMAYLKLSNISILLLQRSDGNNSTEYAVYSPSLKVIYYSYSHSPIPCQY